MKINFFTQDSTVLPPLALTLHPNSIKKGPADSRIVVMDKVEFRKAEPDKLGNFLYGPNQPQFDACETYGILKSGMELYSKILERTLPFAFQGQVHLFPHDGEGINAYYSRDDHGVHFLDLTDSRLKKTLHMAQSSDVGAHEEVGHLLLDGLKPEYLNLEVETQAFHEAFGDISSMILALQFEQVLNRLLDETKGDLRVSNVVSRLAEEAGLAIQALSPSPKPNHNFLRDATYIMKYDWKYQDPGLMPEWNPQDEKKLGSEPHNFSRFFSGVWYEIFVNLYEEGSKTGQSPKHAIQNARDEATHLILRGVSDFAPDTSGCFKEIAKGMLQADQIDNHGLHQALLTKIFSKRGILTRQESARIPYPEITLKRPILSKRGAEQFLQKYRKTLGIPKNILLKTAEDFPARSPRYLYRNQRGETYLTYHVDEAETLRDSIYRELHGAEYHLKGSIKLGFDQQGDLIFFASDLLTLEKRKRIERSLRLCHKNEFITTVSPELLNAGPRHFFKQNGHHRVPYFAYASWKEGRMLIERVPVFV